MNLTISINLDNAAFEEDLGTELASLFQEIEQKFQGIHLLNTAAHAIRDTNGNTVGSFQIS